MRIIFNLVSKNTMSGGSQVLIQQMKFLKDSGFNVGVYFHTDLERSYWYDLLANEYQIVELEELGVNDVVVVSEEFVFIVDVFLIPQNIKYILINQGISTCFFSELNYNSVKYIYNNALAILVNSEHTSRGVQKIFDVPTNKIVHYRIGIDNQVFYPEEKENTICFLTAKNHVFSCFMNVYVPGRYPGWNLIAITALPRIETAAIFRKSKLFLSFGGPEGFGLPPLEAALCGCKVLGFDGYGGKEFFREPIFTTVNHMDHLDFIDKLDVVMNNINYRTNDDIEYLDYLRDFYNLEKSKSSIVSFFTKIKYSYF